MACHYYLYTTEDGTVCCSRKTCQVCGPRTSPRLDLPLPPPITNPYNFNDLLRQGWYWGPMSREKATDTLRGQPNGTFLVRDCSDLFHVFAISFTTTGGQVVHTLIKYRHGKWSFYKNMKKSQSSVVQLVQQSVKEMQSLSWDHGIQRLTRPLSRFDQVKSLQHICRFVIRLHTRLDLIPSLPLPTNLQKYLRENMMV
ncbi:suppressor of cytokine signaling 6-like [Corticium candelabrum]|uniref:suppressor of cytokine signaling 6-like n=1 Tax=Corticium candelabrum TaxID=121492 RepID=UPI002E26FB79|nr:suppressor of cytokine signaling 6-like [Corticium candelabrum]